MKSRECNSVILNNLFRATRVFRNNESCGLNILPFPVNFWSALLFSETRCSILLSIFLPTLNDSLDFALRRKIFFIPPAFRVPNFCFEVRSRLSKSADVKPLVCHSLIHTHERKVLSNLDERAFDPRKDELYNKWASYLLKRLLLPPKTTENFIRIIEMNILERQFT